MKARYSLFSLFVLVSLVLGACAAPTPQTIVVTAPPEIVKETQVVEVTAPPGAAYTGPKARVNLWHTIPTDTETFFVGELMPKFNAAHPECTIVVRNLGVEDPTIIRAGLKAGPGNGPDLWWIASSETGAYVDANVLGDVDGWLNQHPDIKSNIIPSLLELSSYQGKVRSLPWMTNDTAMYLNVSAFDKAGVPVPSQDPEKTWTWDEFRTDMKKVTDANPGMKGFLVTVGGGWDFWTFHSWYAAAGGDASKIPDLSSPAALKAVALHRALIDDGSTLFSEANKGWDPGPWLAQKVAVMADGPWNFSSLSTIKDFKFTVVPFPRDAKAAANLGGDQLFIGNNPDPKVQACSFAFAEYMLSDDFQIAFQINSGNLPVTKSASDSQQYQDHLKQYPFLYGFANEIPYGVARQPIPAFNDITNVFSTAWDDVMLNNKPAQDRFTAAQAEAAKLEK